MPELLLELLSEEIPARMQARAAEDLKRLVTEKLKEAGLEFTAAAAYATPRRLALVVDGLPLAQPDVTEEKRGPRVGAPDQAIQGFLKGAGLTSLDQCEKRDTGKGEFWFAVAKKRGQSAIDVISQVIFDTIWTFPWPKSMRWADYDLTWVRPILRIVGIFNGQAIDHETALRRVILDAEGIGSATSRLDARIRYGRVTHGHRFLDPREIEVTGFADYKAKLREAFVILDPVERRSGIKEQADRIARAEDLTIKPDDALLDEVTGLVEWPAVLIGRIDETFMELPPEVLTTTMRANQKYFSLLDKHGKLASCFLVVSNMETVDKGKAIVAGNERVLRARLSDAKFFWDQDRKVKLEERVPALKDIIFHAKLGTMADKVSRTQALALRLAPYVRANVNEVRAAALLAKADLTTGMVGEFPELQGIMGRYHALNDRQPTAVAEAIAEHYAPLGPNDRCPSSPVSIAVALADKIDTLAGFFTVDERPTGSKDPFALRRAALGVIRLILENSLRLPLKEALVPAVNRVVTELYYTAKSRAMARIESLASEGVPSNWVEELEIKFGGSVKAVSFDDGLLVFPGYSDRILAIAVQLLDFFADRLKVALREKGVRHDLISAVFALGGEDDLVRLLARVDALKLFLESEDGANLLTAYKRASNIVRIEEKKDGRVYKGAADMTLLREPEEAALVAALTENNTAIEASLREENFATAMTAMARLRSPVDAFFDRVTVNCDDAALRANRLRLLSQIRATLGRVADFSQIEG
jgi:glycyl-tRNA synthetase beta chain